MYLFTFKPIQKVGKPTGYRTSVDELNVHTEHRQGRITMNTSLQIYLKK
jgi:hypothetical protein